MAWVRFIRAVIHTGCYESPQTGMDDPCHTIHNTFEIYPEFKEPTIMNLTELKNTPVSELITLGENMGLENLARMRKQDIIFAILKQHAKSGEDIFVMGC